MRKPSFRLLFLIAGNKLFRKKVALKGQKLLVFKAFALSGRVGKSLREIMASRRICNPPSKNVRPIKTGGFVIPQQKEKHTPLLRISNPQSLKRLGHFLTPDFKSGGTPSGKIRVIRVICA